MKKMLMMAMMMVVTISATAMSYNAAKHEALFLSDKGATRLTSVLGRAPGLRDEPDRFYADRHVAKPAPKAPVARHAPAPAAKPNNNATWRNTGNARPNVTSRANGHSNANRQIAQNTSNSSRNSHFGGRR